MTLRYWLCALIGVALCAAGAVAVTFATYGLTSESLCVAGSDQLGCDLDADGLALLIGGSIVLAIPIGSRLFAARKPSGGGIGGLGLGLALTGAAAAALVVGIGNPGTSAEAPGLIAGCVLAAIAPFVLIVGMIGTFANLEGRLTAVGREKSGKGSDGGGSHTFSVSSATMGTGSPPQSTGFGDLAQQLAQIAEARARTVGDDLAGKLRQLDDLRASGLLTPEEHARKRRELLDSI